MDFLRTAFNQAMMPKHEYDMIREEDNVWSKLRRQICITIVCLITLAIIIANIISLHIAYPADIDNRPFCHSPKPQPINDTSSDHYGITPSTFNPTDEETADQNVNVLFIPSLCIFLVSAVFLPPGIFVANSNPQRDGLLGTFLNDYCAPRRGVIYVVVLNGLFACAFAFMALILGPTLRVKGSKCAIPLFWCHEVTSWGLYILYCGAFFFYNGRLGDEGENIPAGRNEGLEMVVPNPARVAPE